MSKLIASLLFAATLCSAGPITYNVTLSLAVGSVTGDIVTDGTIGVLNGVARIVDFNLLVNDGVNTFDLLGPLSGGNAGDAFFGGSALTATPTQLLYNFSGSGDLLFEFDINGNGGPYVCFEADSRCSGFPAGIATSASPEFANQQFTAETGSQVIATTGAPEPSTFVLLGVGVAVLGFRRRGK